MANTILGMPHTSDGPSIKLVDNGDGTYSLGVSLTGGGGGGLAWRNGASGQIGYYVDSTHIDGSADFTRDLTTGEVDITSRGDGIIALRLLSVASANDVYPESLDLYIEDNGKTGLSPTFLHIHGVNDSGGSLLDSWAIYIDEQIRASGTNTGIWISDVAGGTVNYTIKSGAGMVEIGDATKHSGVHIQGNGTFDTSGSGDRALLWIDADGQNPYGIVITNRIAGLSHFTGISVENNGDFAILADSNGAAFSQFSYSLNRHQWFIGDASLQVDSWISTNRNTEPADGDIAANELALWFDPTNGTPQFRFKAKQADGTVVNPGAIFGNKVIIDADVTLPFVMKKNTQSATAPGAGYACLRWQAGTGANTAKLVAYAGTSTTGVTIVDNVGGGF